MGRIATGAVVSEWHHGPMSRGTSIGLVGAASSSASVFVSSELARVILVVVAAATVILLAYWGAKAERRVEEAHRRILELSEELAATAETAQAAHAQAYRPVLDRRREEDYELIVKPIDDAFKRAWDRLKSSVFGATS